MIFGFGGNDGDCSSYVGAVVAAPENGGTPLYWQVPVSPPSKSGGAVWATGGPAVGPKATSMRRPATPSRRKAEPGPYDYSDSVVQLELLAVSRSAASSRPTGWKRAKTTSTCPPPAPELLPGGLLFQAGKDGKGYLIDEVDDGRQTRAPGRCSRRPCAAGTAASAATRSPAA